MSPMRYTMYLQNQGDVELQLAFDAFDPLRPQSQAEGLAAFSSLLGRAPGLHQKK